MNARFSCSVRDARHLLHLIAAITLGCATLFFPLPLALAQNVSATNVDSIANDNDTDNEVDRGDTIGYTVTVDNAGPGDATGVQLDDTLDANTTLVGGSVAATPIAFDDSGYTCVGNVVLNIAAGAGVLVNDTDPDSDTPLAVLGAPVNTNSANGGDVTINADGSFSYDPPAGFSGADTFTYSVVDQDADVSNETGTVTITVSTPVWFINSNVVTTDDGRFSGPFKTIADYNASGLPEAGDIIFLYAGAGSYTTGITLLNNMQLIGEGVGLTIAPNLNIAAGSTPTLTTGAGNAVTLAQNNTLNGFNIGNTAASGISGTNFGTLTASNVSISGTGQALSLNTGATNATFPSVGSTSSTNAIALTSVTGTLNMNAGALSGASGATFSVNGGTADIAYAGSISQSNAANAVLVQNRTGGTVSFSGGITANTGTANGINLASNSGSTITFSSTLDIDTTSGIGFNATGGGTVNAGAAGNTVATTTGTAVNITTTIGGSNINFLSINRNGGNSTAINLANTGAGLFTVTGTGTTAGSGGTIENITGADAVRFDNTDGLVTLKNMIIEDIAASTDGSDGFDTRSGVDAIHGQQVDGGLALDNVTIRRISDSAINGSLHSDGISNSPWNGLDLRNCTFELSNRFHVANVADATQEGLVQMVGIKGTVVVDNCVFQNGASGLDFFTDSSGTLDMTVQRSDFLAINKQFSSGAIGIKGNMGIDITVDGSTNAVIRIGDPAETNAALGNTFLNNSLASIRISHDAVETGLIQTVVSRNTFTVNDHLSDLQGPGSFAFNFPQGGVSIGATGGDIECIFSYNVFDQVMHGAGGVGQLSLTAQDGADGEFIVHHNTFGGPWDFIAYILARNNNSAALYWHDNTTPFINLTAGDLANTDIAGLPNQPLPYETFFVDVKQSGKLDLTIHNETIPDHDRAGNLFRDESFVIGAPGLGIDGGTINLEMENNDATNGYGFKVDGAGVINLFRDGSGAGTVAGVLQDNGNTGGGVNPNTSPPTVVNISGSVTLSNTDPVMPSIAIP